MNAARVETILNYFALDDRLDSSSDVPTHPRDSSRSMHVGTSGQPNADELAAIRDAGYQVLINLVPPDAEMALPNEREIVAALGMEYIHIPIVWDAPRVSAAAQFFQAMQTHRAQKIYVHCEVNYRASSLLYLYRRKYLGTDEKQARQDLQWIWEPNATWKQFIETVMTLP